MSWRYKTLFVLTVMFAVSSAGFACADNGVDAAAETAWRGGMSGCVTADAVPLLSGDSITGADTAVAKAGSADSASRYDNRTNKYMKFWRAIVPRRIVAQYAGGIGLFSVGLGWVYGPRQMFDTDFMLGYVPAYDTNRGKLTITLRESCSPFSFKVWRGISCRPLSFSIYINAITGHEFWTSEPTRYPHKYYGFSTGLRLGASLGQRLVINVPSKMRRSFREIVLYYDFNACDLGIASAATNKRLSLWDVVNVSAGVKLTVF